MTLASAFLICSIFIGHHEFHPGTYLVLSGLDNGYTNINTATRLIALLDSERGIPLAECLREQFSPTTLYPKQNYPRPSDVLTFRGLNHVQR